MFSLLKHRLKTLCLDAESRPMRWTVDQFVRRGAAGRIGLADHHRVHAALSASLQTELQRVLGFTSEFESELYVRRFEADFARQCGRRFAVGTHSGTAALQLALIGLGIGAGDEVITVPYTYVATALAISNTGAKPVFVDIEPGTFNLDAAQLERAITPRTKAILPVHLYGQMANMTEIMTVARAHGLKVVVDACQAFGAELDGRQAGEVGDIGCFSFSTPKTLSGFGNGGMIVCDDRAFAEKLRLLRNPEANAAALLLSRRTPCYLDPVQIAFIRTKLPQVPAWIASRRRVAERYRAAMSDLPVELPVEVPGALHSYYRFALRTAQRGALKRWLNQRGVRAIPGYSPCLHLSQTYAQLGHAPGAFPIAEAAARETLLLPISAFSTDEELNRVIDGVRGFFVQAK